MCVGSVTTYTRCGHHKVQRGAECPAGVNAAGVCNQGHLGISWQTWSNTPSLCVNCYRRHVDDVIARYKMMIAAVDKDIAVNVWKLRAIADDPTREQMKAERSELEVKRGELIDARIAELEEFRIQQGVWGDG